MTPTPNVRVTIDLSRPSGVSQFSPGATHEQYSLDSWGNATAVASGKQLLQSAVTYQNQFVFGWGTNNPEPSPGVYDWSILDERVQLMRDTGAVKVISFCGSPGWMRTKGYQADWKNFELAPDPSHVQDFANLAKTVAQRYPDVKYFQVWSELRGMWAGDPGSSLPASADRWDYERYTTLYNAVYDAVKAVRPDAQIGGPYVYMECKGNKANTNSPGSSYVWGTLDRRSLDVINYWLANKHGAEFLTIDGASGNEDYISPTDLFTAGQKFANIYHLIRQLPNGGATLPIWWAEWYTGTSYDGAKPSPTKDLNYYNALMASHEIIMLQSGATTALIWQPQGNTQGYSYPEGIFTDTRKAGGGKATPYYYTSKAFKDYFGPGTEIYKATSSSPDITVLASRAKTMLVNHLNTSQTVSVNGTSVTLTRYQVTVIDTPAGSPR